MPCGHCIHCRHALAKEWAERCKQEAFDKFAYNVLLTYDDEHLSFYKSQPSVEKVHLQLFFKRLRYFLDCMFGFKISYFAVGEYGGFNHRPHYHVILFSENNLHINGLDSVIREIISMSWNKGFINFSLLEEPHAQTYYMCAYMLSTSDGRKYDKYNRPFRLMSRNPSIGRSWIDRNVAEIERMRNTMDYTMSVRGSDGSFSERPLLRYYKKIIMPEEHKIYFADQFYEMCKEWDDYYFNLTRKEKILYGNKKHYIRQELNREQTEEYNRKKRHERCSAFSRNDRKA